MAGRYWIETLGCPKNQVDSEKIVGSLVADGYTRAEGPEAADLVVVNTCAFIEPAREESIETILSLSSRRGASARLVVTGCLAARHGAELAESLPEVDAVVDVGVPVQLSTGPRWRPSNTKVPSLDLLEMPRPKPDAPWAYVKVAEGCDRRCGFCAIPSFRGPQRSRSERSILAEIDGLEVQEVVLVAQDLGSYGKDLGRPGALAGLVDKVAARVPRVRLLYLYPSSLSSRLVDSVLATKVAYFDLSLQHVSSRHLRRMRRVGSIDRFLERIEEIRSLEPGAVFRSNFILGYPGEREEDHDELLRFLELARLDWAGFFSYSEEAGTYAERLEEKVPKGLALERLRECAELQDAITAEKRSALIGTTVSVLVDEAGVARSYREAPEIDGVIRVEPELARGSFVDVQITGASGPDLEARAVAKAER